GRMKTVFYMSSGLLALTVAYLIFGFATSCKPAATGNPDVASTDATTPVDAAPSPAPITVDAAPTCINACSNMHDIGCAEAANAGACAVTCAHVQVAHLTYVDLDCLVGAKDKAAVRACRGISQ